MKFFVKVLVASGFAVACLPALAESWTDYIYFCPAKPDGQKCSDWEASLDFDNSKIKEIRDKYDLDLQQMHPTPERGWYTMPVHRLESPEADGRKGIFAIESGPHWARKKFILPTKDEAIAFCSTLIQAGKPYPKDHELEKQAPTLDNSVLYSKAKGSPATNRVIAVGYRVQPSNNLKYHFCPNPWGWTPKEK